MNDEEGGRIVVRAPADGRVLGEVPSASAEEVLEAVEGARQAQRGWVDLEAGDRFRRLGHLAEVLGDRADAIADLVHAETGKPRVEALEEVLITLDLCRHYGAAAPAHLRRTWVSAGWLIGKSAHTYREPYGVVGVISPWNYPFALAMGPVVTALYAGNSVIVKPSEHAPLSAMEIPRICGAAGLPPNLVRVVAGGAATGEALVSSGADKIFFTGSSQVGRDVMARAAENLTPVALELGGKDAALVLADADLDRTAAGIVYGACYNAGQTCVSIERVYVEEEIHDRFVEQVVTEVGKLRVATTGEYDVGPITTAAQLELIEEQVEDAVERGAEVLVGGKRVDPASNLFEPTVLVKVDGSMRVVWEETFGPVIPIMKVRDADEAVRLANANPYGLHASVWSEDRERAEAVAGRLRAGSVSINDVLSHFGVPALPHGGTGESGFGRSRGLDGLLEFTRSRSVLVHRGGLSRDLWWFPYSRKTHRLVHGRIEYQAASGMRRLWNALLGLLRGRAA